MSNPYRIIFMGTPDFAAVQLKTLCENGYRPIAVYTQPDKINGRGNRITFSDVKKLAMEENIPVPTAICCTRRSHVRKAL